MVPSLLACIISGHIQIVIWIFLPSPSRPQDICGLLNRALLLVTKEQLMIIKALKLNNYPVNLLTRCIVSHPMFLNRKNKKLKKQSSIHTSNVSMKPFSVSFHQLMSLLLSSHTQHLGIRLSMWKTRLHLTICLMYTLHNMFQGIYWANWPFTSNSHWGTQESSEICKMWCLRCCRTCLSEG